MNELEHMPQHFEIMEKVVDGYVRGAKPKDIARALDIKPYEVDVYLNEWRQIVANDKFVQTRAKEALLNADKHYNQLISQAWEIVEQADSEPDNTKNMAQKNSAIKLIGDLEKNRFNMLKEMGLLDNSELASELAERERKEEILLEILREVICEKCKPEVVKRLSQVTGRVEPVHIVPDEH